MPDFDSDDLHNTLTALKSDTARVGLATAADVRRRGDQRTRATAAVSGLAALAVVAGAVGLSSGLGDRTERAYVPPAAEPKLSASSLLIADEMPPYHFPWRTGDATEGESSLLPELCQRESLRSLGATAIRQQEFANEDSNLAGAQVAAQFGSAEQAEAAFGKLTAWFEDCGGFAQEGGLSLPRSTPDGGRVQTGSFTREIADKEAAFVGRASFGVTGNAVTIVWLAVVAQEWPFATDNPLEATMKFALQRLAGARTTSANAIPDTFRFAEERRRDWVEALKPEDFGRTRNSQLAHPWRLASCAENPEFDLRPLPSDVLRTGALLVRVEGPGADFFPFRQLALYADEAAAQGAAQELLEEYARCANTSDGDGRQTIWTTERVAGPHDVTLATGTKKLDSYESFTRVVGIVHRGNAVLVAFDAGSAESPVVQEVRKAVADNVDLICEVADCE